jgi:Calcineurin-like phosphoesterase
MAKVLNLLTLSDLHISSETLTDQQMVIEKLCDDLRVLGDSDIKPDFVLFAGDLVNDPDESDVYITFLDKFLLPILSATNLSESKCIFIPGNHDVSRRSIEKYKLDNKAVFEHRDEEPFISKLFDARLDSEFILDRQSGFYSTLGALFGDRKSNSDPFAMHYDLPGETLTILGINTAVFSMAGVFGKEKSNLPFPDKAINEEIALIPRNHTILAVHHHPLDWLTETAQRELSTYLG